MLRVGWVVPDKERRKRGQVYHLRSMPEHLQLRLIDNGFEQSLKPKHQSKQELAKPAQSAATSVTEADVYQERLEATLKEVALEALLQDVVYHGSAMRFCSVRSNNRLILSGPGR